MLLLLLSPVGQTAALSEVLARKGRMAARWRADDSLFSALNLDLVSWSGRLQMARITDDL